MLPKQAHNGWFWVAAVFALIGANVCICTITVIAARSSQPPIESNYDAKALRWDDSAQQRQINQRLGWRARVEAEHTPRDTAPHLLVRLLDSEGRPIRTALVVADIEPDAGGMSQRITMTSDDIGGYRAALPAGATGWWRIAFAADAGGMRFCDSSRVLVSGAALGAMR